MIPRTVLIGLWLLPGGSLFAQSRGDAVIDTTALRLHTRFLSDDHLLGRATGTPGVAIAARYIRAACEGLGLEPVGPSYLLPFDLIEARVDTVRTALRVTAGGRTTRYDTPNHIVLNVGRFEVDTSLQGRAVLVGTEADVQRDTTTAPFSDAIAVVDGVLGPDVAPRLAARGFAAAVYITPNNQSFDLYRRSRGATRLAHADSSVVSSFLPRIPTVLAAPVVAQALVRGARQFGGRVAQLTAELEITLHADRRPVGADNVGCRLPGRDSTSTDAIVYTAHYDHLGVSEPDAAGDTIYNGFSDNAAGVAMLLGIADAFQRAPPRHTILFLFFSGEERGLLGSDAFVHRSPWPLQHIRGVINLDAGAPPGPPATWRIAGGDDSELGDLAVRVATTAGWTASTSAASPNSDYYPFWRLGIPSVFIVPGTGPYEGMSPEQSTALKERWDRYHQAGDHWAADFPFGGLARYARYAWLVGRELDRN